MSQHPSVAALAFRNRNGKYGIGNPVTTDTVEPSRHAVWPSGPQYQDPHPQNLSQDPGCDQYAWVESFDDSTVRPSTAADKNASGYMFNGHLESAEKLPPSYYASWYFDHERPPLHNVGGSQDCENGSFATDTNSWYGMAPEYLDGSMGSPGVSNALNLPVSTEFVSMPMISSGGILNQSTLSLLPPPTLPSLPDLSDSWSQSSLHTHFTDIGPSSTPSGSESLVPSTGSEFDFPGVSSFSICPPTHELKVEDSHHQHGILSINNQQPISLWPTQFHEAVLENPRAPAKKRQASPGTEKLPVSKKNMSFNDCVTVFETVPGVISQTKRRRKLSPSSHESFKVTRKIGACLECRFRKRPCSPGTPCPYCLKIYGPSDIAEVNCHRESPFVGYTVTDYFLVTSNKRVIDFRLKLPKEEPDMALMAPQQFITIDGRSGPCSLPTVVPVRQQLFTDLSLEDQAEIWRTKRTQSASGQVSLEMPEYVTVPAEDDEALGRRLETWVVKYASQFSKYHTGRYPTASAYNVGILYIAKKLPEHELIAVLLKGVALAYVLRAGVKCTPETSFRIVEAKIDTILYSRLRAVEAKQFAMLQKLVWVSAGRLKQQQLYPVAYVLWQTMRSICLRASHLANLQCRFKGQSNGTFSKIVDHLGHCFDLLLATHTALFRGNSPIILDFTQANNQALLGGDQELIKQAMNLREVILNFQEYSLSRPFRSSNWYRDGMYRRFRGILYGKGVGLEAEVMNKSKVPIGKNKGGKIKVKVESKDKDKSGKQVRKESGITGTKVI